MEGAWLPDEQLHLHALFQLDDAPAQIGFGHACALRRSGKATGLDKVQPVATGFIDLQSGELGALFVLPAYIGQGIGRSMLLHLERLALEAGISDIHLDATPNAAPFYRCCGYLGTSQAIYLSPTGLELPCVPMRKRLGAEVL